MTDNTETGPAPKPQKTANKGGRPRKDVTKTPEFKEAVEAAAAASEKRILAALTAAKDGGKTGAEVIEAAEPGDREMISRLALSIAELSDQSAGRKRIPPAVLAARQAAFDRMLQIIVRNHARGWPTERPLYRVISATYLNEQLIQPYVTDPATKAIQPQLIDWEGIPNEAMEPINDIAKQIWTEYQQFVGGPQALTPNADTRQQFVTPNGLTIRGGGVARREVGTVLPQGPVPSNEARDPINEGFEHKLALRGPHDPRAKQVRVLGTVAEPARQAAV